MGLFSKGSKAPAAPDYAGAAKAQGAADRATAQYLTEANRVNQYSPTGSVTWKSSYDNNPEAQALQQKIQALETKINSQGWAPWNLLPMQEQLNALKAQQLKQFGKETISQNMTLTPEEQAIFNANQGNRLGMEGLAGTAIKTAGNTLGSQFSPSLRNYMTAQGYQGAGRLPSFVRDNIGLQASTLAGLKDVNERTDQFQLQGDQVRDALYKQLTRFNQERFGEQSDTERNRLAQMGLQEGTQAYQNAIQEMRRSQTEADQGSQLQAILAGGQEQSRMVADQLAARASNIGLRQGQFEQGMSRDQQDMLERQMMQQYRNNLFNMSQSENQFRAQNQLNLAQQAAQQRNQQFQEQAYQRSLPINEISALLNGGGVQMPQQMQFAQATPFQSPDIMGATQAGYNAQMGRYNAGAQQKSGLLGAGASILGSWLGG